ncbi:MAG: YgiT-type zinc finger domain-containing protein [Candidatus Chloroheliales bacterium]|nr:MAG: YgiT-type zinc finger domain-containing protein [Chloroflexota bacterium]
MLKDICGEEGGEIIRVTKVFGEGDDMLIIENIPMISCANGEGYFTAETLHEIEGMKMHRDVFATKREVLVARFTADVKEVGELEGAEVA